MTAENATPPMSSDTPRSAEERAPEIVAAILTPLRRAKMRRDQFEATEAAIMKGIELLVSVLRDSDASLSAMKAEREALREVEATAAKGWSDALFRAEIAEAEVAEKDRRIAELEAERDEWKAVAERLAPLQYVQPIDVLVARQEGRRSGLEEGRDIGLKEAYNAALNKMDETNHRVSGDLYLGMKPNSVNLAYYNGCQAAAAAITRLRRPPPADLPAPPSGGETE